MKLSNDHVVLPAETFHELSTAAYENTPTPGDRAASVAQTFLVFGAIAGAVTLGSFGVAKVQDWAEERRFQRETRRNLNQNKTS